MPPEPPEPADRPPRVASLSLSPEYTFSKGCVDSVRLIEGVGVEGGRPRRHDRPAIARAWRRIRPGRIGDRSTWSSGS